MNRYHVPRGSMSRAEYSTYVMQLPSTFADSVAHCFYPNYDSEIVELDGTIDTTADGIAYLGVTPPAPVVPIVITKLTFLDRFTPTEMGTILTVAKTNVAIEAFMLKLSAATEIHINDPRTIAGVQALEAYGLIGAGRAAVILTP